MAYGEGVELLERVMAKGRLHLVAALGEGGYRVLSGVSGNEYVVRVEVNGQAVCECKWGFYHPMCELAQGCSHMQAVREYVSIRLATGKDPGLLPEPPEAEA